MSTSRATTWAVKARVTATRATTWNVFGNGRFARNVLEAAIGRHAWRLREVEAPSTDELRRLLPADLEDDADPADPEEAP